MLFVIICVVDILAWVLVGFLGFLIAVAGEMRGRDYDWYFYNDIGTVATIMCIAGPIGLVTGIIMAIASRMSRKNFGEFIHNLVNVGKKNKDKRID